MNAPSHTEIEQALTTAEMVKGFELQTWGEKAAVTLADAVRHLRARVAELEAERSGMNATEWGVRWSRPGCGVTIHPSEALARYYAPGRGKLVSRTAPGPWREAT